MKYIKPFLVVTISIIAIAGLALHFDLPRLGAVDSSKTVPYDTASSTYVIENLEVTGLFSNVASEDLYAYSTTTLAIGNGVWTNVTFDSGSLIGGGISYSTPTTTISAGTAVTNAANRRLHVEKTN